MARARELKPGGQQQVDFRGFSGINNVVAPEKCKPDEFQVATNVYTNLSSQVISRPGRTLVYSGRPHSLFSNGSVMLFREGVGLYSLDPSTGLATILRIITGDRRMNYFAVNNLIYYSDESVTGITDGLTSRSWGLEVPAVPALTATVGTLPPGRYLCSLTFVRNDGQESGAPLSVGIDLTSGGIIVSNIPISDDPTVAYVNIYISTTNGELLYRAMSILNGVTVAICRDMNNFIAPLRTQHLSSPPAGHIIQFYKGRHYIAKDNVVWYTEPYSELVNLAHNFIMFPGRVTLLAPVTDGIWCSFMGDGQQTMFLHGEDPDKAPGFKTRIISGYAAIEGSQQVTDEIISLYNRKEKRYGWLWAAPDGIHMGLDSGEWVNLTRDRYAITGGSTRAASLIRKSLSEGIRQYLLTLFDEQPPLSPLLSRNDTIRVSENVSLQMPSPALSDSEAIDFSESVLAAVSPVMAGVDRFDISEYITLAKTPTMFGSEAISVSEIVGMGKTPTPSLVDTVSVAESISLRKATAISRSDTIAISEVAVVKHTRAVSITDQISIAESAVVHQTGVNMVINGDFETWVDENSLGNSPFTGWYSVAAPDSSHNRDIGYTGMYSDKIVVDASNNVVWLDQVLNLTPNTEHQILIRYKMSQNVPFSIGLSIYTDPWYPNWWLQSDGKWSSNGDVVDIPFTYSTTWALFSLTFTTHQNAGEYEFFIGTPASGVGDCSSSILWVDDVSVKET